MKSIYSAILTAAVLLSGSAVSAAPLAANELQLSFADGADGYSYTGTTTAAVVHTAPSFSFDFNGTSLGYTLTLELGSQFANQTGLVGYVVGVKIGSEDVTWAQLQSSGYDPQTYTARLSNVQEGAYWLSLVPITYGSAGGQALVFSTSQPGPVLEPISVPVPEPETYAMFLAGLAFISLMVRSQRSI